MLKTDEDNPKVNWARAATVQLLLLICGLVLGSCALTAETRRSTKVDYSVSQIQFQGNVVALKVDMRFAGDADGQTLVQLPTSSGSERDLWRAIQNLRVNGGTFERRSMPQLVISHAPNQVLIVSYEVASSHPNELISEPEPGQDRPIIRPTWVSFIGKSLFPFPVGAQARQASFVWRNLPSTWNWGSDLQQQRLTVAGVLDSSTLAGLDVQKRVLDLKDGKLTVVWRGTFDTDLETTFDALSRIVDFQHKFWRSGSRDFTVTIVPLLETVGPRWVMGTGLGDGFAIWAASNVPMDGFEYIFAHELLHEWINQRGKLAEHESLDKAEAWFIEGFTDYYAIKSLMKIGAWSEDQTINWWNGVLLEYQTSPGRGKPNDLVTSRFWTDPVFERLPYVRGSLIAMYLDNSLQKNSTLPNGLDDVMLTWNNLAKDGNMSSVSALMEAFELLKTTSVTSDLPSYAIDGKDIPFEFLGDLNCMAIQKVNVPKFERGFDLAATIENSNYVVGVTESEQAFRAGMRNGMKLEKLIEDRPRNSNIPVKYEVSTKDGKRVVLSWLPKGSQTHDIWQFSRKLRTASGFDGSGNVTNCTFN
ncbi:MAG: hypothetical protein ACK5WH_13800 [Hyphomonadaceae bacterium]